jgi:propanol-preferring alcohol dehydrogenase
MTSPGNVGMACDGAYAEYMALPARNVVAIPQDVSDVDAAIAADAIATPYHACREEARVGPGDRVLIVGAGGGVGVHAVQMAKLSGGWVLAADITDDKLAAMLEIHGSRYVTLTEIAQMLELLRQRRIRAIVSRTFPLEGAEEAHELLRKNALVGRAALVLTS